MKILIKAKPSAKENGVLPPKLKLLPDGEDFYIVQTREKPIRGQANEAIGKLLAEYFGVAKSQVILISGQTSKRKVYEIKK